VRNGLKGGNIMKKQLTRIALATLGLALSFTLSCSSDNNNNNKGKDANLSSKGYDPPGNCPNATIDSNSVTCGGETYETVVIGSQIWFKRNLNYAVEGSKCYGEDGQVEILDSSYYLSYATLAFSKIQANCDKYGRLYNWQTAKIVCPSGWRLPNNADWDKLYRFVDGTSGTESPYESFTADNDLKAKEDWDGKDTYGFAALPGGYGYSDGLFNDVGIYGIWWSASESTYNSAYHRDIHDFYEGASWGISDKSDLFNVRCLQDIPKEP